MIVSPSKVRQLALDTAKTCRPTAKFQRVSKDFIDAIEAHTRAAIVARVKSHPSKGVTLK